MRGSRNTTQKEKKNSPKFSSAFCDQNFSSAFALKKHRPFLSTLIRQRKRKKWSRLPKVRALCSFPAALFLSFSLSLLFPRCAFFAFVFFLSLLSRCFRACVCVRASVCLERRDLRLGVLFPSQPQVFFSCALICTDFVSSLYHLASSFHSVCCIGAGYVGGPTMAMIALKCPHIEVMNIFLRDDDLTQSAGEKETMDSHNLLSRLSRKIAKFV